jgi:hypothetical protein
MTSLSLQSDEERDRTRGGRKAMIFFATLLVVLLAAVGYLGYEIWRRAVVIE